MTTPIPAEYDDTDTDLPIPIPMLDVMINTALTFKGVNSVTFYYPARWLAGYAANKCFTFIS